jgi:hypothetical protein
VEAEIAAKPSTEKLTGYNGTGFVELDRMVNADVVLRGGVPSAGRYAVSFRYSNGSGPVNTNNKCAIRTLLIDGNVAGPIVLPQRGENAWSDWGDSSWQQIQLPAGEHRFELRFEPYDENMDGEVNRAMIDSMTLTRIQ